MPVSGSSVRSSFPSSEKLPRSWLAWSSGKDSLWALHAARRQRLAHVVGLLTTVTDAYSRVSMHAVREELLRAQAAALKLPLHIVRIPTPCSEEEYGRLMRAAMEEAASQGVAQVIFGDLYLEQLRAYRERELARVHMRASFPLWGRDTSELAREMVEGGLRAIVTCVDPRMAPSTLAGRQFDRDLLAELPDGVDPCGENGEFHTFVWDGPGFDQALEVSIGETVERDGFVFTDVSASANP
ncbi:MAG: adenine nucleotide alpha hydrolase [Armatimonadetes bacterium]|nr:adenine nucleotide alpha hydrolase [Armatimonadota bacterium]